MCYDGQKVRTKNSWSSMWRIDQLHSQYFMNWFYNYSSMCYGQKVKGAGLERKIEGHPIFCGEFHHKTNDSKNQAKMFIMG